MYLQISGKGFLLPCFVLYDSYLHWFNSRFTMEHVTSLKRHKKRELHFCNSLFSLVIRLVSENSPFYYQISNAILFCIRVFRHSITLFILSE